ncbi:unnamed protein product [Vitrella brassicaformis CCMP3155]|uniref:Exonuclease domain-containing protein n=2 Tax=Vitrella brassicaformis TaxID=1169539 RepID=A0A0G4FIZ3_VITBC|nr:unnamed protein product [Vitrella brassicaformis CCMP3155]|eukprot:CEM13733.1 unnamed protein product [Vitrella brassicaformis CCMP3155]
MGKNKKRSAQERENPAVVLNLRRTNPGGRGPFFGEMKPDMADVQNLIRWAFLPPEMRQAMKDREKDGYGSDWIDLSPVDVSQALVVMVPYLDQLTFREAFRELLKTVNRGEPTACTMRYEPVDRNAGCSFVERLLTYHAVKPEDSRRPPQMRNKQDKSAPPRRVPPVRHYFPSPDDLRANGYPAFDPPTSRNPPSGFIVLDGEQQQASAADAEPTQLLDRIEDDPDHAKLFGLDCEMCETENGMEITRVSIVNVRWETVVDTFVRPAGKVTDYLTRYSGISEETLKDVTTGLSDVHEEMRRALPHDAILVGHSMENDLTYLRLVHTRVLDTALLYPHPRPPNKSSLQYLVKTYLHKEGLDRKDGHDSVEDAKAALRLAILKLENGPGFGGSLAPNAPVPFSSTVPAPCACASTSSQAGPLSGAANTLQSLTIAKEDHEGRSTMGNGGGGGCVLGGEVGVGGVAFEPTDRVVLCDSVPHRMKHTLIGPMFQGVKAIQTESDAETVNHMEALQRRLSSATHTHSPSPPDLPSAMELTPPCKKNGSGKRSPPQAHALGASAAAGCVPRVSVCVLRDYQRLCSANVGMDTGKLYTFNHRVKRVVHVYQRVRDGLEPLHKDKDKNREREREGAMDDGQGDGSPRSNDIDLEAIQRDSRALFPPLPSDARQSCLRAIEGHVRRLYDAAPANSLIVILTGTGDAARYLSMMAGKKELTNLQHEEDKTPTAHHAQGGRPDGLQPLRWTTSLDCDLERAKATFSCPVGCFILKTTGG